MLFINEVSSTCIEIYNSQNQAFDLYGVHAALDSGPNTRISYLPLGSTIAPHGYLTVFSQLQSVYFNVPETDHTLRLLVSGVVVDEVNVPHLEPNISYARVPDGSPNWQLSANPTINASNNMLPTPTATSQQHKNSGGTSRQGKNSSGNGSANRGSGNTADTASTGSSQDTQGVQPTWSTLRFPTSSSPSAVTDETAADSSTPTNPPSASPDNRDTPKIIVTVLLIIALALTLFWCWRLLSKKSH
jgi:hypothetical protein